MFSFFLNASAKSDGNNDKSNWNTTETVWENHNKKQCSNDNNNVGKSNYIKNINNKTGNMYRTKKWYWKE